MVVDLPPVQEGQTVLVSTNDIHDSEFGGLLIARQQIFPTERLNAILGKWIKTEKNNLFRKTGKTEAQLIATEEILLSAREAVVLMVGRKILKKTQTSRVEFREPEYIRLMRENQEEIDNIIENLKDQDSPITMTHAEPSLLDPDSDYPDDDTPSDV